MFIYRLLKKIEQKSKIFLDLGSYKHWNNLIALTLPNSTDVKIFDFEPLFELVSNNKSILLVGNASPKNKIGEKVNAFEGDIVRFNRFQNCHTDYVGFRVTHWFVANSVVFDERKYMDKNLIKIKKIHPDIQVSLITTINSEDEINQIQKNIAGSDLINIIDSRSVTRVLKALTVQYIQQGGRLIIKNHPFLHKHGYIKPSTGLLSIIYALMNYEKVFIHNFDFFKSQHYWADDKIYLNSDNNGKFLAGIELDHPICDHEFLFEETVFSNLVQDGLVQWLN
jgi:hypothetical protein